MEQKKRLGRLYARGRAKWALEQNHLVDGSSSAPSAAFWLTGTNSGAGNRRGRPGATPRVTANGPHGPQLTGLTQSTADWAAQWH